MALIYLKSSSDKVLNDVGLVLESGTMCAV
jgi:hypothetical protein